MKKSMFSTMPEWVSRKVELPVANVEPKVWQTKGLNDEQIAACEDLLGRHEIIASAGTGKSTVLIARLVRICQNYPKAKVLMISFTKKAVGELRERIGHLSNVDIVTFHSLAYKILKSADFDFTMDTSTSSQEKLLETFIGKRNISVAAIRKSLHDTQSANKDIIAVRNAYLKYLHENHIVTFDTMQLFAFYMLLKDEKLLSKWQKRYDFILVDEFMDVDAIQVKLMELLSEYNGNLTVCGDMKQAIYSFRYAVPNVMEKFAENAKTYDLTINYRSNSAILGLANRLMNVDKPLVAAVNSEPIFPKYCVAQNSLDEAKTVADEIENLHKDGESYNDIVIIYRSSSMSKAIQDELTVRKIPFAGKSKVKSSSETSRKPRDTVKLMTIHASKGMEFKTVFIVGAQEGSIPSSRSMNLDEEKRLLYVAITRAKERLFISYPRVSDNNRPNEVSRFLREAFSV